MAQGRGRTTYDDIVPLLEVAHHPASEPVQGATDEELRRLEERLGLRLPSCLADWLRVCRGSTGGPGGLFGTGSGRQHLEIDWMLDRFPEWRGRGWIPVAGDGCGNYYVLLSHEPGERIGFVETMKATDEIAYVTATSLHTFLREMPRDEVEETGWPFDRDYVALVDPDLLAVSPGPFDAGGD